MAACRPRFTIDDLADQKCAVINDGTRDELNKVLKAAFPGSKPATAGGKYYIENLGGYVGVPHTGLPVQSVKHFLTQLSEEEREIIGYSFKEEFSYLGLQAALIAFPGDMDSSFGVAHSSGLDMSFIKGGKEEGYLRKAGVLDLWFKPVYAPKFKPVKINGYLAVVTEEGVEFGCQKIPWAFVLLLNRLIQDHEIDIMAERDKIVELAREYRDNWRPGSEVTERITQISPSI